MDKAFSFSFKNPEIPKPAAVFAWKLLDITEIWEHKQLNFLINIQRPVLRFHKNLEKLKRVSDFTYEEDVCENANKCEIVRNVGDDTDFLQAFLEKQYLCFLKRHSTAIHNLYDA